MQERDVDDENSEENRSNGAMQPVGTRVEDPTKEEIEEIAEDRGVPVAQVLREAAEEYVEEESEEIDGGLSVIDERTEEEAEFGEIEFEDAEFEEIEEDDDEETEEKEAETGESDEESDDEDGSGWGTVAAVVGLLVVVYGWAQGGEENTRNGPGGGAYS